MKLFYSHKRLIAIAAAAIILLIGFSISNAPQVTNPEAIKRDDQRKSDLLALQTALTLYAENNRGAYPIRTGEKIFITSAEIDNEFNKKILGQYLPKAIADPGNPNDPDWPAYLYWQVDNKTYVIFAKLENEIDLTEKLSPENFTDEIKTYDIKIGTTNITYNWWLTKRTPTITTSPTVKTTPKPTLTPTLTPTNTSAPNPPRTPPGLDKKK